MVFDSKLEEYFSWWLEDLKTHQFISEFNRPETRILSEPVEVNKKVIIEGHGYTGDFEFQLLKPIDFIVELDKYKKKTLLLSQNQKVLVEIKPAYDQNNMTRLFMNNRKWLYQKHGEYWNLVKLPNFFAKTFTPIRYLLTDSSLNQRKIKFKVKTLEEWIM